MTVRAATREREREREHCRSLIEKNKREMKTLLFFLPWNLRAPGPYGYHLQPFQEAPRPRPRKYHRFRTREPVGSLTRPIPASHQLSTAQHVEHRGTSQGARNKKPPANSPEKLRVQWTVPSSSMARASTQSPPCPFSEAHSPTALMKQIGGNRTNQTSQYPGSS